MALFGIEFRGILIANGAKDSYGYDGYGLKVMNQYGFPPCERSTLWVYFFSQISFHNIFWVTCLVVGDLFIKIKSYLLEVFKVFNQTLSIYAIIF